MKVIAAAALFTVLSGQALWAAEGEGTQVYHWGQQKVEVHPAADAPDAPAPAQADQGCTASGLVEAEGIAQRTSYPNALPGADSTFNQTSFLGTAAGVISCGHWNYQAVFTAQDFLPYSYSFGNRGWSNTDLNADAGFDVYWRDPNSFMIGAGVRRSVDTEHFNGFGLWSGQTFDVTDNFWSGTVFAELYPSDDLTLGLTGFYESGDSLDGGSGIDYQLRSYGGSAYARYYWTPNLRLSIRAIISQTDDTTSGFTYDHMNAVATAFYKFDGTPVTMFGGLRYGSNDSNSGSSRDPNNFVQGFAGVQVALGAHANGSLLEQDRNGVNLH